MRRVRLRHAIMNIVRFAPSPTGRIHIGNGRAAILNWLFALKTNGQFILRYDDTDTARSTQEFADRIKTDVEWLGIKPHRVEWQSKRFDRYDEVAADLRARGLIYACYETADELDRRRKRQQARGLPPIYDRASLKLTPEELAAFQADGRKPHWRFKLANAPVDWEDMIRGPVQIDTATLSDPVLIREDGTYLYTLPSVIDDVDMAVTHVIRGEDHVVNTAVQIEITRAIGGMVPAYGHYSMLLGSDGKGLSKRIGSLSIQSLRESGLEAMAVVSHAALLGTSDNIHPCTDIQELVDGFDLGKLSRAPARFDEAELAGLNAKLLHMTPFSSVASRLDGVSEAMWLAVRGNIEKLSDVSKWRDVIIASGNFTIGADDESFISRAREVLPEEPWDQNTWKVWTEAVKAATDRKGKTLFMPLRMALTGLDHGPELATLLPLIGRQRTLERLD
jgi:glutamyl-tRNA synthetase